MLGGMTRHMIPHQPGVPHLHTNRPLIIDFPNFSLARWSTSLRETSKGKAAFLGNLGYTVISTAPTLVFIPWPISMPACAIATVPSAWNIDTNAVNMDPS